MFITQHLMRPGDENSIRAVTCHVPMVAMGMVLVESHYVELVEAQDTVARVKRRAFINRVLRQQAEMLDEEKAKATHALGEDALCSSVTLPATRCSWALQTACVLEKSFLEIDLKQGKMRALMQLQAVVDQHTSRVARNPDPDRDPAANPSAVD